MRKLLIILVAILLLAPISTTAQGTSEASFTTHIVDSFENLFQANTYPFTGINGDNISDQLTDRYGDPVAVGEPLYSEAAQRWRLSTDSNTPFYDYRPDGTIYYQLNGTLTVNEAFASSTQVQYFDPEINDTTLLKRFIYYFDIPGYRGTESTARLTVQFYQSKIEVILIDYDYELPQAAVNTTSINTPSVAELLTVTEQPKNIGVIIKEVISWISGIVAIISLISIIITPIITFRYGKKTNTLLTEHHLPATKDNMLKLERDLILLSLRGARFFKAITVPIYLVFGSVALFSLGFPPFLVILAIIFLPFFLLGRYLKKKIYAPLTAFDQAHPDVGNKKNPNALTIIEILPEFADSFKKQSHLEKVFLSVWYFSFINLIGSLLAWAIINFTVCCAANVTM